MKTLVQFIMNASAAAKAWLLAADAAAQKALLSLTKSDVGLGNVDNTSDASKPVSTAQAAAIAAKIGGSVGATTNRLVKSSGTDTLTVQSTGITVDASNNVSGVGTISSGAITSSGAVTAPVYSYPNTTTPAYPASGMIAFCPGSDDWHLRSPFGQAYIQIGGGSATNISSFGTMMVGGTGGVRLQSNPTASGPSVFLKVPSTSALNLRNTADSADIDLTCRAITASGAITAGGVITLNGNQINWGGAGNAYTYGGASIVSTLGAAGTFQFRNSALSTVATIDAAGTITASGDLICSTAGKGLQVKSGTGARAGTAVLVAGTVTVTNTTVTASTRIFLTVRTTGGTLGTLSYTLSAGASFTINSSSVSDTSTVTYFLIEVN